ncbi:MAG: AAA family ATPase [Methylotetracoccus sp.]
MNASIVSMSSRTGSGDALRQALRDEMEAHGLSQRQVSREAGVDREGSSKLNQWLQGSYRGDNAQIDKQLSTWLEQRRERRAMAVEMPAAPEWVETPTAARIYSTLNYAQLSSVSACIYGGAGVGKTLTCQHYQSTHNNVWIVTCSRGAATHPACLRRIAQAAGLRGFPQRTDELEEHLVERFTATHGLLVLDEAQILSQDALWGVKHLFDLAKIGVAYVGSEQVYVNLAGRKSEVNAPLFRRISKRQALKQPTRADVEMLLDAWSVVADKRTLDTCLAIAEKPGALGMMTETLRLAAFLAMGEGKPVDAAFIKAAHRDLGVV